MTSSAEIRARAAQDVAQVLAGRSLEALTYFEGSAQERGLWRTLVYDSIRWFIRLDALLKKLLARPQQRLDSQIRALAVVGLYQLLYTDIAQHAAVAETVNAARVLRRPRAAGLVNAILRRCQREGGALLAEIDRDITLRTAHPRWLVDMLHKDFPEDFAAVLDANNARPPFWIRVNRLRTSAAAYRERLEAAGLQVVDSRFEGEALLLARAVDVNVLPGFDEGLVSVQDAAAQLAARLLAPRAGERILDACAAPGGKTAHLLELEPNIELTALDVSAERLERVKRNLARLGMDAEMIVGDAEQPHGWWNGKHFDRILLDAPCSGTGVIRRHPDIKLLRRSQDIPALAARQAKLLDALWPLLAAGGRLVYATCSALRAENSEVIRGFLERRRDAKDVTHDALRSLGIDAPIDLGYRIAPGTAEMDGFYYACLEKTKG